MIQSYLGIEIKDKIVETEKPSFGEFMSNIGGM